MFSPRKREEVTTEGGLDLFTNNSQIKECVHALKSEGIRVSLFIDPKKEDIEEALNLNSDIVEIHTGSFSNKFYSAPETMQNELQRIKEIALLANNIGLEVHAGHGLNYETTELISKIKPLKELNIGHFIIGESVFDGLDCVIKRFRAIINNQRKNFI